MLAITVIGCYTVVVDPLVFLIDVVKFHTPDDVAEHTTSAYSTVRSAGRSEAITVPCSVTINALGGGGLAGTYSQTCGNAVVKEVINVGAVKMELKFGLTVGPGGCMLATSSCTHFRPSFLELNYT